MKIAALIVAAGRGTRAGGGLPKQWRPLLDRRVIDWTISAFEIREVEHIQLVINEDDIDHCPKIASCIGGSSRAASVANGLSALPEHITHVLIHDAARPCVSAKIIRSVIDALKKHDGAAPGVPVTDALWCVEDDRITAAANRDAFMRAQTPQGFNLEKIRAAHARGDEGAADDVELALKSGMHVALVPGDEQNLKITLPQDIERAARILES